MNRFVQLVRNSPFVQNVAVLASGTAFAQAVVVLTSPILSRLYDPTAFGILAVIIAIAAPLIEAGGLKYEAAIILAKREEDAANLVTLSGGLVLSIALIMTGALFMGRDWIAEALGEPAAAPLLFIAPGFVLIAGLHNVVAYWANRRKSYNGIASADISRSASMVLVQVLMGVLDGAAKGLVLGRIVGQAFGLVAMALNQKNQWSLILNSLNFDTLKSVAREHSQFPKYSMPRELLASLSASATPIFISIFLSPASAGLYWFAVRLLEAPKTMIGLAVRRVFYVTAAELHHDGENIFPLLAKTTLYLVALAVFPTVLIILFGPDIFDVVFGSEWRRAGVYAQWLILWWMSSFCVVAATALIPILELQRATLTIEVVGLGLRMAGLSVGILLTNDVLAIALYSIAGFLVNVIRMAYVFHRTIQPRRAG